MESSQQAIWQKPNVRLDFNQLLKPLLIHTLLAAPSFFYSFTLLIISLMLFFQLAREAEPELLFVSATSTWWAHLSGAGCSVFGLAIFHKCSRNHFSPTCADNRTNKGEPWPLWPYCQIKHMQTDATRHKTGFYSFRKGPHMEHKYTSCHCVSTATQRLCFDQRQVDTIKW